MKNIKSNPVLKINHINCCMEERIGSVLILIENTEQIADLNQIISNYANVIIGRQGIRIKEKGRSIISLVLEGTTDSIGGLTGQLGRLKGIKVKSIVIKNN